MTERNAPFLSTRLSLGQMVRDAAGPVVLEAPEDLEPVVRDALGSGSWVELDVRRPGVALYISDDPARCADAARTGVPTVLVADGTVSPCGPDIEMLSPAVLPEWIRAFSDGEILSAREAGLCSWIGAVRQEELRNQREAARIDREERAAMRRQLDDLSAHVAGIEASRAWVLSRRMIDTKAAIVARLPRRLRRALG